MTQAPEPPGCDIYQLKVTLKHIKPPIWRRFQIPGDKSLYRLHQTLQVVMGWEDYHLHEFRIAGDEYGEPDPDFPSETIPERRIKIYHVLTDEKMRFTYVYDFGDDWEHELVVEKILEPVPGTRYPVCLAGKRHQPPEDVGGPWGYERFLEAIRDPEDEQHEQMLQWVGGGFDPERFDLEAVNRALKQLSWARAVVCLEPASTAKAIETKKEKRMVKDSGERVPKAVQPVFDKIVGLLDEFCKEHLNAEYAEVSRRLAGTLARKRPSPLSSGKPEVWACAIVYTVGSVNFLFDKTQTPYMSAEQLSDGFGVSKSTCANRAGQVRRMLRTYQFDPRWTLPSLIDSNPYVWMIEVNGLIVDARHLPRPLQEEAFRRGLIPYVPANAGDD